MGMEGWEQVKKKRKDDRKFCVCVCICEYVHAYECM